MRRQQANKIITTLISLYNYNLEYKVLCEFYVVVSNILLLEEN